jgi:hypothetical protein
MELMERQHAATLQNPATYDGCLISTCLKNLFVKGTRAKAQPDFIISKHISEVKGGLERLNKDADVEMSYGYLATMEDSMPDASFRYAVIYKHNVPVLCCYFQLFTLTSKNFNLKKSDGFVKGIMRFFIDLKKAKVLIAGNALRNEAACFCYDENALGKEEATRVLASVAEKIAADENASAVILKDIPVSAHSRKWLGDIGYQTPWEDKVMAMDIDKNWETLAGYTAALSRKYKTRANKILSAASTLTVSVLTEEQAIQYQKEIDKLFTEVVDNQQFTLTRPAAAHFARLKELYKDDFEIVGFFDGSKLVAFYSAFVTGKAYEIYYCGLNYGLNTQYQLYFNILFSGLERAILLGKKQLKLGRTSFDAKASMGAKPANNDYFVKTAGLADVVRKWFVKYFSSLEDNKWKQRNPLKEATA